MSPETVEQIPELLPCPFCGSAAEIVEAEEAGPQAYVVQCTAPLCAVSSKVIFALKEDVTELLIEAWNRRPSSEAGKGEALPTDAQVAEAMQDAWNDICGDTGCHPLDITQGGKGKGVELTFDPNHWARFTAMFLRTALQPGHKP